MDWIPSKTDIGSMMGPNSALLVPWFILEDSGIDDAIHSTAVTEKHHKGSCHRLVSTSRVDSIFSCSTSKSTNVQFLIRRQESDLCGVHVEPQNLDPNIVQHTRSSMKGVTLYEQVHFASLRETGEIMGTRSETRESFAHSNQLARSCSRYHFVFSKHNKNNQETIRRSRIDD